MDHGCISPDYYYDYKVGMILVVLFMAMMFIVFGILNKPDSGWRRVISKWKTRWVFVALIWPVFGTVLEVVWHFIDYNDLKHLLKDSEDEWSFAQRLQIGLVFGAVSLSLWTGMEVDNVCFFIL
ncbi:hypothetical protein DM02DRAFT_619118 [Periconia macrospinosa]|uniref:Uncharacterized protein n=1 Tax=Periconia macrospinosa TaxID=97972 RepID=A0A2V1D6L7_9PLEO|nr:hypothetical protein DM02DRAFT_619118 [Periconia macrospinosa]